MILEMITYTGNFLSLLADHTSCGGNEDPLACSSPVATAQTSRKRKTLEISPIHHIPSKRSLKRRKDVKNVESRVNKFHCYCQPLRA